MKPVVIAFPRCESSDLLFKSCDSVATLPVLANRNKQVAKTFFFATVPAYTQRALYGAHSSKG
jgi:hypothetical protein